MKTYSIPRYTRHRARVGLVSSLEDTPAASPEYRETFRGRPCPCFSDFARRRTAARQTSDPLNSHVRERVRPSPLVLADSFREAIQRMQEDGDKVAESIIRASADGRLCNPKLPGNYYAWRHKAGQVSYTPAGRELRLTDDGRWRLDGRQETTPARFARQVLRESTLRRLGDAALSAFAVRFRAAEEAETLTFDEWTGEEGITRAYDEVRGTGSCMEGDPVGEFYSLAGARVLVAIRQGSAVARAILWTTDEGLPLCDRVYAAREEDQTALLDEARRRGYWTKQTQTNGHKPFVSPDGSRNQSCHTVTTPRDVLCADYIPYLDSLYYWDEDAGTLSTHDDGATHQCRNTDGTAEELGGVTLADGRRVDEDDAVQDVDGEWRHRDEVYEVAGDYYPDGDERVVWCEHNDEYILTENARRVTIGRATYIVHEDQIEEL